MPRRKAAAPAEEIKGTQQAMDLTPVPMNADALIEEHFRNEAWLASEQDRFSKHIKPVVDRQEAIKNQLMEKLNAEGLENIKTSHGTAYKSRILQTKIDAEAEPYIRAPEEHGGFQEEYRGREALLEFALDHWDQWGNEMLILNAQKDAVKQYLEANGKPPPGVTTSTFVRINIRRS